MKGEKEKRGCDEYGSRSSCRYKMEMKVLESIFGEEYRILGKEVTKCLLEWVDEEERKKMGKEK